MDGPRAEPSGKDVDYGLFETGKFEVFWCMKCDYGLCPGCYDKKKKAEEKKQGARCRRCKEQKKKGVEEKTSNRCESHPTINLKHENNPAYSPRIRNKDKMAGQAVRCWKCGDNF